MDYSHPYDAVNNSRNSNPNSSYDNGQQGQVGGENEQVHSSYNEQAPVIATSRSRPVYTPSTPSVAGTAHTPSTGSNSPPGTAVAGSTSSTYMESVAATGTQSGRTLSAEIASRGRWNRESEDAGDFDGIPYDLSGAEGFHPGFAGQAQQRDSALSPVVHLGASLFPASAGNSSTTLVTTTGRPDENNPDPEAQQPIQILRSPSVEHRSPSPYRGSEGSTSIALAAVGMLGAGAGYTGHVPPPPPLPTFDKDYNIVRKPSMAQRLMGGLGRMRTSKRISRQSFEGNYSKLDERDEDEEAVPTFDVTSYQPDFVPASSNFTNSAGLLMPPGRGRSGSSSSPADTGDLSNYDTSYKGPVIDLSDDISLYSRKTGFKQEIIIPRDGPIDDWKPHELRLPYLIFLNISNLSMLGAIEYLIQQSYNLGPTGLFQFDTASQLSIGQFFSWKYLPTIVGVVYGVLWELTDTEVKRVEPYFQMSRPDGAIARNSLNVEYFSFWSFLAPVQALRYTQWAVVLSASASVLAYAVVPNLLGALLNSNPVDEKEPLGRQALFVDKQYARALEVMFAIITILGLMLTWLLARRKTGLVGDVSGIAGIAAMANKSHILNDFHDLDEASEKAIHQHLSRRKYRIHKMSLYLGEAVDKTEQPAFEEPKFLMFFKKKRSGNPQPPILTMAVGIPFIAFMMIVMVVMSVITFVKPAHIVVEKFPFLATGLGILIKSIWEVLDKEMRVLQPFWDLSQGNARPETLTLDYTATIPGLITIRALKRKHWLLALVTLMTVLVEVLTVGMGAFLNRAGQVEETSLSKTLSYSLAVIILTAMMFTQGLVILKRRTPFLPRQPGTIASVLTFIHQSKMVTDFHDMENWTTAAREKKLVELNKRYAFGWFSGRDRQIHLGIDEEPMRGKYNWGQNYKAGVVADIRNIDHY